MNKFKITKENVSRLSAHTCAGKILVLPNGLKFEYTYEASVSGERHYIKRVSEDQKGPKFSKCSPSFARILEHALSFDPIFILSLKQPPREEVIVDDKVLSGERKLDLDDTIIKLKSNDNLYKVTKTEDGIYNLSGWDVPRITLYSSGWSWITSCSDMQALLTTLQLFSRNKPRSEYMEEYIDSALKFYDTQVRVVRDEISNMDHTSVVFAIDYLAKVNVVVDHYRYGVTKIEELGCTEVGDIYSDMQNVASEADFEFIRVLHQIVKSIIPNIEVGNFKV